MTTTVDPTVDAGPEPAAEVGQATVSRQEQGAPARGGSVRGTGPLRDWCVFTLVLVGRVYRALLLTLLTIAMLPALGSWTSYLVRTGSMEPSISAGDVVLARPFGADEKVPVGRVMIFKAPPGSGVGPILRIHRVVENLGHDEYKTAGDANPTPDAAPVPRDYFRSRALIRVPYVGLPLVWQANRQYGRLLLWLLATMLLLYLSFRPVDGDPPDDSPWSRGRRRIVAVLRLPGGRHRGRSTTALRVGLVLGSLGVALAVPASANAAFTDRTTSGSNTWKAASNLLQRYTAAVKADSPYAFYRLDDESGVGAADSSGNNHNGTYTAVPDYQQAGALPNNPGYSIRLAGASGRMVGGGNGLGDPTTFSIELWFRTTTTAGGKLVGFENSQGATSTLFDREAFLRTDGRVVYLGGASTNKLLVSPTPLNNGAWHHLVITSVPSGASNQSSAMYVDGALVASGTTTKASTAYVGWWRAGYGRVPAGTGYPLTGNFTGSIDDVAIYTTQLSATRVAAHYAAR